MSKEILMLAESLANTKGVEEGVIFEAIEAALAAVAAKRSDEMDEPLVRVAIDRDTGEYEAFRQWEVAADEAEVEFPEKVIRLAKAHEEDENLSVGDIIEEPIEAPAFGRIAAQQAKQVILQKVREAERDKIAREYGDRVGELIMGVVKRVTRDCAILDMGGSAEAVLDSADMIPRESFRMNDRIRVYLKAIREDRRGPQLEVSRTAPAFLMELFKIEVPEIGEQVIEIMAAARDAGSRAKIAVKTNDGRIDPIGACVGMRGSRVQAVSNELAGERIDIVLWDDSPAQLVINAMAPAEVASIVVDEDSNTMDIAVAEEMLSQAIGRGGQNIRLASQLSGWTLNVMSEEDAAKKQEGEADKYKDVFKEKLGVDDAVADVLVQEGFTTLEEVAYVDVNEMLAIDEFDESLVEELQRRAGDILLTQEIASESAIGEATPDPDLVSLEGMDDSLAKNLAQKGVVTRDDLADFAVDELVELIDTIDDEQAGKLIMAARAHWFEQDS